MVNQECHFPLLFIATQSAIKVGTPSGRQRNTIKRLNTSETNQIPTPKPYIHPSYDKTHSVNRCGSSPPRCAHLCPTIPQPIHFTKKGPVPWKPFLSPPINHIYSCFLWQDAFSSSYRVVHLGMHHPIHFIKAFKAFLSGKTFRSPALNHTYDKTNSITLIMMFQGHRRLV